MKATIEQGITRRAVGEENAHQDVFNDEVIPVVQAMRDALNFTHMVKVSANTAGNPATYVTVWTSEEGPTTGIWFIEARVTGIDIVGDGAAYYLRAAFRFTAGAPALVSSSSAFAYESAGPFDWQWAVGASTVSLTLKDNGVEANFTAIIQLSEAAL